MGFTQEDFNNPEKMLQIRTRKIRVRIQQLESDLAIAQHPFSRAVIKQELDKCVDEYVARTLS